MKKIGIIGGVGPQATRDLYNSIIEFSIKKYGAKNNDDFPHVLIESVPIPDFISNTKDIEKAKSMLIGTVKDLEKAGATVFCIGSNTVHILLDDLRKETKIKFISTIDVVSEECQKRGFKKAGILGSPVTKKYGLYSKKIGERGIEAVYPSDPEQVIVDQIIRHVMAETDNGQERSQYIHIFNTMLDRGCDGIILACTELPQAIDYEALGKKVVNSNEVLAERLVDYYYGGR